jgi:uncharacterized protein (TIGR03083 family)
VNRPLVALRSSVEHLAHVVQRLNPAQYGSPAYPTDWSIADVFSHLGSSGAILTRRFDDIVAGRATEESLNQPIWEQWNAKAPASQVREALDANVTLLERLESLDNIRRDTFQFSMGPMDFDFSGFVGLRLNELVLHTWDVEVMIDPSARLWRGAVDVVVDNLDTIVRFSGRPSGVAHNLGVRTVDPYRLFTFSFGLASVELISDAPVGRRDLEIPAEALIRLVYGRLDPAHTPLVVDVAHLDDLRRAFPGI